MCKERELIHWYYSPAKNCIICMNIDFISTVISLVHVAEKLNDNSTIVHLFIGLLSSSDSL